MKAAFFHLGSQLRWISSSASLLCVGTGMAMAQQPGNESQPTVPVVSISPIVFQSGPDLSRVLPVLRPEDRITIPADTQQPAPPVAPVQQVEPLGHPAPLTPSGNPLDLQPLSLPNISVQGVGTGAVPESVFAKNPLETRAFPVGTTRDGVWYPTTYFWQAATTAHKPLYFEEVMLERNGQQRFPCLQPMISGAKFFGNIAILPYHLQLNPPYKDEYVLGPYRPGSSAPALYERPPFRADAATVQAAATAATFIAVP